MENKKIIVLVGPSGSGKTSIGKILEENGIPRLVTTTTRPPREGEMDGVDYYFRDFSAVDMDEFIEQTIYNDNRYGLTKAEVDSMLKKHQIVHVALDRPGAEVVRQTYPNEAFIVFVQITEEEMVKRMKKRGDSETEIAERIAFSRATNELASPDHTDLVVKNIDLEESARIILDAVKKELSKSE